MDHTTFSGPCEGNTVAIERLDTEIRQLTEQLYRLKIQRNSLTITYSLPSEVLTEIFLIVQANCKFKASRNNTVGCYPEPLSWLLITHVSHHWRTEAIDCAQLWCEIEALPTPAIREFLIRSRGYDLSVGLMHILSDGHRYIYPEDLLTDIFNNTFRLQKLSIHGSEQIYDLLPYITSMPAPNLQQLMLAASGDGGDGYSSYIHKDAHLFQGITPQLQILSLAYCDMRLDSPLFLADLTILDITFYPKALITKWLDVLKGMPRLAVLNLRHPFKLVTDNLDGYIPVPATVGVVHFPQLSQLIIKGTWLELDLDFLSHITFPSQTTFRFSSRVNQSVAHPNGPAELPLQSLLRVHNNSRRNLSEMGITGIQIDGLSDFSDFAEHDIPAFLPLKSLEVAVRGEFQNVLYVSIAGLRTVDCSEESLSPITSLPTSSATSFTTNLALTQAVWRAISDWLPNLQRLTCTEDAIRLFLEALAALPADFEDPFENSLPDSSVESTLNGDGDLGNEEDSTNGLFKLLESLHISQNEELPIRNALIRVLRTRVNIGLPIKEIHFEGCRGITEEFVADIKAQGLVEEVIRNSYEPDEEDADDDDVSVSNVPDDMNF